MTDPCQQVDSFFDRQLSPDEERAFKDHYATCEKCDRRMAELIEMDALVERRRWQREGEAGNVIPLRRKLGRAISAGGLALAASIALVVAYNASQTVPEGVWQPSKTARLIEGRSSHALASAHRPEQTGTLAPQAGQAELPLGDLDKLKEQGKHFDLASAYLVRNQLADQALQELRAAGPGPESDSERALAYLVRGDRERGDLEAAVRYTEKALEAKAKHGPALWNKALAVEKLGLKLHAARTFDQVVQLGEPGWADEARERAARLRRDFQGARGVASAGEAAGKALLTSDAAPDRDEIIRFPDFRWYFYDAVRMRESAAEVDKLLPVAKKLDRVSGGTSAQDYVRWVSTRHANPKRAGLAKLYAQLVLHPEKLDPSAVARLWTSGEPDLAVGAKSYAGGPTASELKDFEDRCQELRDPWFDGLALRYRALEHLQSSRLGEAREFFERAIQKARVAGLPYRELRARLDLLALLLRSSEMEQAYGEAAAAWKVAEATGDLERQLVLIQQMAQMARLRRDVPLARAYLEEVVERARGDQGAGDPELLRFGLEQLAAVETNELNLAAARTHLEAALATGLPLTHVGAMALADVARVSPRPAVDGPAMEAFRASWDRPRFRPGELAQATHALGRWKLEVAPEEGRQLLEEAIRLAGQTPSNPVAARALASSYTSLIMDAGKRGDFKEAAALWEKEVGAPLPTRCAVALTADSERSVVLAFGPDGNLEGEYDGKRTTTTPERLDGFVTPRLLRLVERCAEVKVLARPPLFGRSGALPGSMAWAYVLPRKAAPPPPPAPGGAGHLLVVQSPEFSERRQRELKSLPEWLKESSRPPDAVVLSGRRATPSAVLQEMKSAGEVVIVTHSLVNRNSGEAFLVLAEEGPGEDRLRAGQLEPGSLPLRPLVSLVACEAATPSDVLWTAHSLPAALLEAGARTVLAATEEIPADDGPRFFDAVRKRIREGAPPAIALRDERQSWGKSGQVRSWEQSVLIFE